MKWLEVLNKVGSVAGVVVPIVAPQASAATGLAQIAISLVNAATNNGEISTDEVAQINALLIPHGFAIVHLETGGKK